MLERPEAYIVLCLILDVLESNWPDEQPKHRLELLSQHGFDLPDDQEQEMFVLQKIGKKLVEEHRLASEFEN